MWRVAGVISRLASAAVLIAAVVLSVLLLGGSVSLASSPTPSPQPTTAGGFVAKSWTCERTAAQSVPSPVPQRDDCAVTGWATLPPFPVYTPPAVQTVAPAAPFPVMASSPLPVREVDPAAANTYDVTLQCSPGSGSSSPSPSASTVPSPSAPSPSSSPQGSSSSQACPVTLTPAGWQAIAAVAGALVMLATIGVWQRLGQ